MCQNASDIFFSRPGLIIRQSKCVTRAPTVYGHHKRIERVMAKDNMECAFTNVEISLRIFFTLMVNGYCSAERSFTQLIHEKSE